MRRTKAKFGAHGALFVFTCVCFYIIVAQWRQNGITCFIMRLPPALIFVGVIFFMPILMIRGFKNRNTSIGIEPYVAKSFLGKSILSAKIVRIRPWYAL